MTKWVWDLLGYCYRILRPIPRSVISPREIRSLLIVRPDYLGDTLLFLPKLREIRRALPDAAIDFAASPDVRELLERTGWVDDVIEMAAREVEAFPPRGLPGTVLALRKRAYDVVLATSLANFNTGLLLTLTRSRHVVGYAAGYNQFIYTKTFPFELNKPVYKQDWELVEFLGGRVNTTLVPYPIAREEVLHVEQWLSKNGLSPGELAVLHYTAAEPKKKWDAGHWRDLARGLGAEHGLSAVFTGIGRRAFIVPEGAKGVYDLTGDLTLGELGALMQRAGLVVSVDTGPLHMAAALGVPTVGLYTDKALRKRWGYGPEFGNVTAIVADSCGDNGLGIPVGSVLEAVRMALSGRPRPRAGAKQRAKVEL